jgi:hypothetical protein
MSFRNPVGPVAVTPRSGIDVDPATGVLRLYTTPVDPIRVDAAALDLSNDLEAAGAVRGRSGVYRGGIAPAAGTELLPVRAGTFTGNTAAGGYVTAAHGGPTTPIGVSWQLTTGTAFGGPGFTMNSDSAGPANIVARLYDASGAPIGAGVAVVAFWIAVYP